jgi:hypothetical protein
MQAALKLAGREKWCGVRRLSTVYGYRMSQSLILIDALFFACWEKKKRDTARELFFQGQTGLAGCAAWDFHGCYVQLKTD